MISSYRELAATTRAIGLACRGGFAVEATDGVPPCAGGREALTLVLLGFVGADHWSAFRASLEYRDGCAHPLDRWSERRIRDLAADEDATALFPFGGPPYLPFQRWAQRAEPVHVSPLRILIHPVYGLWHAYRGALAFARRIELPVAEHRASPCESCAAKPCLHTCPVQAVESGRLGHERCRAHVRDTAGRPCHDAACLARASCPVGASYRYGIEQARFHMAAFAGLTP